jgi:anti-sigma regulatory factor (Ser/Thr protein kinase)
LVADRRWIGTLTLERAISRGPFVSADRDLCIEVAGIAAQALVNAISFRHERETATVLQKALLSTVLPVDARVLFDSVYVPAGINAHVGGDWYDVFRLDGDRFAVSMGDVAGHGVPAARTMNVVRIALRSAVLAHMDAVGVLDLGDRMLDLERGSPMVTAIYGVIDVRRQTFAFASAGHCRPLLLRADGSIEEVVGEGFPLGLGMRLTLQRASCEIALRPGDSLVLYTDGLTEQGRDLLAGERTLQAVALDAFADEPRCSLAHAIHRRIFGAGVGRDDVAVLTVSMVRPRRAVEWRLPAVVTSVPVFRSKLAGFISEIPLLEEQRPDILLAVGEAVANAVEHAYDREGGSVIVRPLYEGGELQVEIVDHGRFRPAAAVDGRGFGLKIMRALACDVRITSADTGTIVRLGFRPHARCR